MTDAPNETLEETLKRVVAALPEWEVLEPLTTRNVRAGIALKKFMLSWGALSGAIFVVAQYVPPAQALEISRTGKETAEAAIEVAESVDDFKAAIIDLVEGYRKFLESVRDISKDL